MQDKDYILHYQFSNGDNFIKSHKWGHYVLAPRNHQRPWSSLHYPFETDPSGPPYSDLMPFLDFGLFLQSLNDFFFLIPSLVNIPFLTVVNISLAHNNSWNEGKKLLTLNCQRLIWNDMYVIWLEWNTSMTFWVLWDLLRRWLLCSISPVVSCLLELDRASGLCNVPTATELCSCKPCSFLIGRRCPVPRTRSESLGVTTWSLNKHLVKEIVSRSLLFEALPSLLL